MESSQHQATTTSAKSAAEDEERAADAGEEAGFKAATSTRKESSSRGDWPHELTTRMTISHLVEGSPRASSSNSGDLEVMMDTSEPPRRSSEDSDEGPINLATAGGREEAINLSKCNIRNTSPIISGGSNPMGMMSAKMRLKQKQRLEAVAKAVPSESNFYDTTSALHRLANVAAERKQEEDLLDLAESMPLRGTSITLVPNSISNLTPTASPQLGPRIHPTPSPDSAIHSASGCHSPSQSPISGRQLSGLSSPFSIRGTPSLSRNNSDASQNGRTSPGAPMSPMTLGGGHLSSPQNSPLPIRHPINSRQITLPSSPLPPSSIGSKTTSASTITLYQGVVMPRNGQEETEAVAEGPITDVSSMTAQPGISRQQLINSPCPVCGDKISGFHYGIFSCESCKGFFKRTVQNKKNYQCLRGASCPISIATRKKCPACRYYKCLNTGMKLEAIREDRTRGGRSTYQCSYTLPTNIQPMSNLPTNSPNMAQVFANKAEGQVKPLTSLNEPSVTLGNESQDTIMSDEDAPIIEMPSNVPILIQEIMNVEHLWFSTESAKKNVQNSSLDVVQSDLPEENMIQTLTNMADKRLFKLVKWCKSLPLFKNILIDDQISLLINAWCELLVFSCCYRSIGTPGTIRVSNENSLDLPKARAVGLEKWFDKMLNFTEQLRRLKVDHYEYVSMKVIVLLTSDASGLKEPENVRDSQEKVVQALQSYTIAQYPDMPSKFAELLLRMPELHRVCQGCKDMLGPRQATNGETPGFNLLMELLKDG